MEVNQRGNSKALEISPALVGLRDEADEYAMEDREDGVFKEKRNDNSHRSTPFVTSACTAPGPTTTSTTKPPWAGPPVRCRRSVRSRDDNDKTHLHSDS
jgi:hypothetical protein